MNETMADIVREMRNRADLDGRDMVDNFSLDAELGEYGGYDALKLIRAYADRIEAAHKREVADALDTGAFVEAAHKREKATTEKASPVGDAAKMREALEYAHDTWVKMYEYIEPLAQPHLLQVLTDAGSMMETALSAPPRNCDAIDCNWLPDEFYRSIYGRLPVSPEELDEFMQFSWLGFVKWIKAPYEEGGSK